MTLVIPDDAIKDANLTEPQVRLELACRLFELEKLELWPAAQLANLTKDEFTDALGVRGIPWIRMTIDDVMGDVKKLEEFERHRRAEANG